MEERTTGSTRPFTGKLISVRVDEVELANGHAATREVVEHPGAVGILAWDGARLAMVSQWRHATGREMLEIPAGTLDPGESPRATAERELGEECGLAARRLGAGAVLLHRPRLLHRAPDAVPGHRPARDRCHARPTTSCSNSRG